MPLAFFLTLWHDSTNNHSKPQSNSRANIQVKKAVPIGKFKNWWLDFREDKHGQVTCFEQYRKTCTFTYRYGRCYRVPAPYSRGSSIKGQALKKYI